MGKRKRRVDNNNNKVPPHSDSDTIPHAPQADTQSEQGSLDQVERSTKQTLLMDATDSSLKRSPGRDSAINQTHGSSHRILLRHSRHPFGRHYSRRSTANYSEASPSNLKASPVYDHKFSVKPESKILPVFPCREIRERMFQKPERIRSSSLVDNSITGDVRKMECWICQKRLRKHPFVFENSLASNDLSVVAVLVCGHAYHANCLEQKTSLEDSQDPPCPLCVSSSYTA